MNEHYAAVLADLRQRRAKLETDLRDVEAAISGIQRLVNTATQGPPSQDIAVHQSAQTERDTVRFRNISVRWGVLWFLSEAESFVKTGEIAAALLDGGYKSEAVRFPNMVSAVLSAMKTKDEVQTNAEGGYRLTERGRNTWAAIRQGAKFRIATSPSERSLLSAQ
jgi:hypothetical protein